MKRNSYGMSHKLKTDIPIGVHVPILSKELVPGDIFRCDPEVLIKAVVPPVTQLTDNFKYTLEWVVTPDRLLDDKFVANMSTTKTGEVKGDFKHWTIDSWETFYGNALAETPRVGLITGNGSLGNCPSMFAHAGYLDYYDSIYAKTDDITSTTDPISCDENGEILETSRHLYNSCWETVSQVKETSEGSGEYVRYVGAPWFGQNSLLDYLGLNPTKDIGLGYKGKLRTNHISAYYMYINFYHTNPEYQKYLAPDFDYHYPGPIMATQAEYNYFDEGTHTLHRYESLEEEFGNGFIQPRNSGRCWRGLVIANWDNGYFSNTTVDAQRGIAPQVPVSIVGRNYSVDYGFDYSTGIAKSKEFDGFSTDENGVVNGHTTLGDYLYVGTPSNEIAKNLSGSFVISDLRTALALQHFQEDAQGTYKWSDFLLRMFGTAPVDNLQDKPFYIGGSTGYMSCGEVLQTAETAEGSLGDIGGKLSAYDKGKRITYSAKEHCVIQCIITIKPERNFQSGIDRQFTRINYLDMYWKQFVGIGAQAIRADEICVTPYGYVNKDSKDKNWGFTDRYEEMKHMRNRITGGCRSVDAVNGNTMMVTDLGNWTNVGNMTTRNVQSKISDNVRFVGLPNLDKHMFAIGNSYTFRHSGIPYEGQQGPNTPYYFDENCNLFLLCLPQLSDVFVSEKEIPFLLTVGFNCDMFRPVPVYTKPGVQYV